MADGGIYQNLPGNNCVNICEHIKVLIHAGELLDPKAFIWFYDPDRGCYRATVEELFAANTDEATNDNAGLPAVRNLIGTHTSVSGTLIDFFETITSFGTPVVNDTDPDNVVITLPFNQEGGTVQNLQFTVPIPSPVSTFDSIDLKFDANGDLIVEAVYTDDDGNTSTITDTTPVVLPSVCDGISNLPLAAAIPTGAQAIYHTAAGVCGRAPFPAGPEYITCDGSTLTTTDRIVTAPTGAYASGYTVNQSDADGCLTLSDIYYNRARRSHTFGEASMSNDAQGYGSSITGGLRNITATGAAYSHIGGGYDHSITIGTTNGIGWGRNNDITAGSYNGIVSGYNQNITAGNYNTIGGGVSNDIKAGSYNTIVGGSAIDFEAGTGSYNVAGGVNTTFNGGSYTTAFGNNHRIDGGVAGFTAGQQNRIRLGNYVSQFGYSHDNVAGNATTQGGYNHTNTSGSYNSQFGYAHIIDAGQSIFQGGQSNRNRSGNYVSQLGLSHDNQAGSYTTQLGYNHTNITGNGNTQIGYQNRQDAGFYGSQLGTNNRIRLGNYNTAIGTSHDIQNGTGTTVLGYDNTHIAGAYNYMLASTSIHRSGNYSGMIGYSHDNTGTGNMLIGYNNTTNTNYSVSIGRNLNNTTQDGIMIANNFQRLGFFGTAPITRQTANTLPQLLAALKAYGLIL